MWFKASCRHSGMPATPLWFTGRRLARKLPSWEEAHMRVQRERRPSKVNHPSPAHTEHVIPAPTAAQPPSYVSSNVSDHSRIAIQPGEIEEISGRLSDGRCAAGWRAGLTSPGGLTRYLSVIAAGPRLCRVGCATAERVSASLSRVRSLYGLHGLRYAFYPK